MANSLVEAISSAHGLLLIEVWSDDLRHATDGHPEVTVRRIRETLKDPSKVIQSKNSVKVCLFYSFKNALDNAESMYFCVVVAVMGLGVGK